jgi:putative hydroxymethylpyrimidine transport system substrate-binding protein
MLETHGLTLKDVELVNVNFSLSPALISKQVDAVIGAYRNFELNQMDILGRPGRAFYVEEEGVPAYDELILVANTKDVARPAVKAFVGALERAVIYVLNHPDEAWAAFAGYKKGLDDELNKRAWRDTLPRFALRPAALDVARYERFAAFVLARGLAKSMPPVDAYARAMK